MARKNRQAQYQTQDPPVYRQEVALDTRYWPDGVPLPQSVATVRRVAQPCPACRRVRLDDGGQAAACISSGADLAYFRCKACGNRWKLQKTE